MVIIASNGAEIVDDRPEAEINYSFMLYLEERAEREKKKRRKSNIAKIICNLIKIKEKGENIMSKRTFLFPEEAEAEVVENNIL